VKGFLFFLAFSLAISACAMDEATELGTVDETSADFDEVVEEAPDQISEILPPGGGGSCTTDHIIVGECGECAKSGRPGMPGQIWQVCCDAGGDCSFSFIRSTCENLGCVIE
jgi:hypothetical protein